MAMHHAYAIQNALLDVKLAQGGSVLGWKIGLTSKAMKYVLNVDIPDSDILVDDMIFITVQPCLSAGSFNLALKLRLPLL